MPTGLGYLPGQTPRVTGEGIAALPRTGYTANVASLPEVSDPEETFAQITRGEYQDFVRDFGAFEDELIHRAQTDTTLVDQAKEDRGIAADVAAGVARRNAERYGGGSLTQAQLNEQKRALGRSATLGGVQSVNDSRLAQRDLNQSLLAGLIDIGQGVNQTSQAGLADAAANASQLDQQYQNARTQSRNNTIGTIASLGSAALIAAAI